MYYLKFIGTENTNVNFSDMLDYTVLNTTRWELELPVLACIPNYLPEGETIESAFCGIRMVSRAKRLEFEIEFYPFSTLPTDEHNTGKRMQLFNTIFSKSVVWLAMPSVNPLPRYDSSTGINEVKDLLPCRIEPDFSTASINKEQAREELTINVQLYKRTL